MPPQITVGSRVKSAVGPLYWPDGRVPVHDRNEPNKKRARRSRMVLEGTVISSVSNSKWRVYWDDLACTGDHLSKQLNVVPSSSSSQVDPSTNLNLESVPHLGDHRDIIEFSQDNLSRHHEGLLTQQRIHTTSESTANTDANVSNDVLLHIESSYFNITMLLISIHIESAYTE